MMGQLDGNDIRVTMSQAELELAITAVRNYSARNRDEGLQHVTDYRLQAALDEHLESVDWQEQRADHIAAAVAMYRQVLGDRKATGYTMASQAVDAPYRPGFGYGRESRQAWHAKYAEPRPGHTILRADACTDPGAYGGGCELPGKWDLAGKLYCEKHSKTAAAEAALKLTKTSSMVYVSADMVVKAAKA